MNHFTVFFMLVSAIFALMFFAELYHRKILQSRNERLKSTNRELTMEKLALSRKVEQLTRKRDKNGRFVK